MKNQTKYSTKTITYTAILTALYVVLSALLKIPVAGRITVDFGYVVLFVSSVYLGAVPAMIVGALGAFFESILFAERGLSIGWVVMNAIIGYLCGMVLSKAIKESKKKFIILSIGVVLGSALLGVLAKTLIDCLIYNLPFGLKLITGAVAWALDSFIMLAIGMPLSLAWKKRINSI